MVPLTMIPIAWRVAGIGLLIAGIFLTGLSVGRDQVQIKWDRAVNKQLMQTAQLEAENRKKEQSMQQKLNESQNAAAERETKLRADYAAAHAAAVGLRDTVAALRGGLSATPVEACRSTADAALAVFGECSAEVGRLAEAADGHASDVVTLREAWPE